MVARVPRRFLPRSAMQLGNSAGKLFAASVAALAVGVMPFAGCGGDDDGGAIRTCDCAAGQLCDLSGCDPGACVGAICNAGCPGGNCTLDCDDRSRCNYSCSGGGCAFDCDANANCTLTCANGCDVVCDGNSKCTVNCTGGTCALDCQNGGVGTCRGAGCRVTNC